MLSLVIWAGKLKEKREQARYCNEEESASEAEDDAAQIAD